MSADNVVPIRPGMLPPSEIGWVMGPDGQWHPPAALYGRGFVDILQRQAAPEHIKGPFVLAMTAHMEKLVAEAAGSNFRYGYERGREDAAIFVPLLLIATGVVCFFIGLAI